MLKNELEQIDTSLTFKIPHVDNGWNRLIGATNTQGRLINNSSNPCSTSAINTTGNFIHIEQEKIKLREDSAGWLKIKTALENVFECDPSSVEKKGEDNIIIYPNPSSTFIKIETSKNLIDIQIMDIHGNVLPVTIQKNSLDISFLDNGTYILKILVENKLYIKRILKK